MVLTSKWTDPFSRDDGGFELNQARAFVTSDWGCTEFLMLKFSKSDNWGPITRACLHLLEGVLHEHGGNINIQTLHQLAGKVIILFPSDGLDATKDPHGQVPKGILGYDNLLDGGSYKKTFDGMQFWGKGGTDPFKPVDKLGQNEQKHIDLWEGAEEKLVDDNVMRLMYWTTTGLLESIEKRDEKMWDTPNRLKLKQVWESGVGLQVQEFIKLDGVENSMASGMARKSYMPNIIMIAFVNPQRSDFGYDLNKATAEDLRQMRVMDKRQRGTKRKDYYEKGYEIV